MEKEKILLTKEGLSALQTELKDLVEKQRPLIVAEIRRARELGDLSENGAYSAARERQSFVEGRIQELEAILKSAEVVEKTAKSGIIPGSMVTLACGDIKVEYMIVGEGESNVEMMKISIASPLGQALLGKKIGDIVKVSAPAGEIQYKIENVE